MLDELEPHDTQHARMISEIATLHPGSKAVLYIVEPDSDGSVNHILNSFGIDDEWVPIMGLLASGQAYCASEMFTSKEETSAPVDNDFDEEPEATDGELDDAEAGTSA